MPLLTLDLNFFLTFTTIHNLYMTDPHSSKESASTATTMSKPTKAQQRPRLSYLRSAWTTTDLYYASSFNSNLSRTSSITEQEEQEEQEEEDFYSIKLPSIQLHDYEDETAQEQERDEIIQEIFRMITVANVLCLSGSIVECGFVMHGMPGSLNDVIKHYQDWTPYAILPLYTLWWLFMILVLKNRTEHLRQYLNWTQASAIVMASTNFMLPTQRFYPLFQQQFHTLFVALAILASFIFAFAKRILMANELKQERLKSRVTREHVKLQAYLDQQTLDFSRHRLAFLNTVSLEIQDVALMVITTLEQFSPASILSNTHELLSACSLAVPIASISAINTTIRQVCHISSHLELLSKLTVQAWTSMATTGGGAAAATTGLARTAQLQLPELNKAEFDIGDLLQNIGDALAGVASKLDVNLVVYHCDNSLHHTLVIGDEGAIRHALLNVSSALTQGGCISILMLIFLCNSIFEMSLNAALLVPVSKSVSMSQTLPKMMHAKSHSTLHTPARLLFATPVQPCYPTPISQRNYYNTSMPIAPYRTTTTTTLLLLLLQIQHTTATATTAAAKPSLNSRLILREAKETTTRCLLQKTAIYSKTTMPTSSLPMSLV